MDKLTKAQRRVLESMEATKLGKHFDVWTGDYWAQGASRVSDRTADILLGRGLITLGPTDSLFSGHRCQIAHITEAGRSALASQKKGDGRG